MDQEAKTYLKILGIVLFVLLVMAIIFNVVDAAHSHGDTGSHDHHASGKWKHDINWGGVNYSDYDAVFRPLVSLQPTRPSPPSGR